MLKYCLLIIGIVICSSLFCQQNTTDKYKLLNLSNFRTFGYIDGVQLDSLSGKFAFFECREFSGYHYIEDYDFDIGQQRNRRSNTMIVDEEGNLIQFNSAATLIDFLDYNGWEFKNLVSSQAFGSLVEILFIKK